MNHNLLKTDVQLSWLNFQTTSAGSLRIIAWPHHSLADAILSTFDVCCLSPHVRQSLDLSQQRNRNYYVSVLCSWKMEVLIVMEIKYVFWCCYGRSDCGMGSREDTSAVNVVSRCSRWVSMCAVNAPSLYKQQANKHFIEKYLDELKKPSQMTLSLRGWQVPSGQTLETPNPSTVHRLCGKLQASIKRPEHTTLLVLDIIL